MTGAGLKAAGALALAALFSGAANAKVPAADAQRLKAELTPTGAERAASADGGIPAWSGGLTKAPAGWTAGKHYADPFPEDKPLFTLTGANFAERRERLTPGQQALFAKFADSYRMNVYPTRRTFANPEYVYEATFENATRATLGADGDALQDAVTGVPFPIPASAMEVIWNHKVRWRDNATRWNNQFTVATSGEANVVKAREDMKFAYGAPRIAPENLDNVLFYLLQTMTAPARQAGSLVLIHETMDPVREARRAWQYNPGQRRLRRAPNVAYDTPAVASDGLRTHDQMDTFSGALDRYEWKLGGKRELYVPANSYVLHGDKLRYKDIVRKNHLNPDLPRYELRRCWVVDAMLKPGVSHLYRRRTFYVDEDSWQIVAVDIYDNRDLLWRVQETHTIQAWDRLYEFPVAETVYDLDAGRYLVEALSNEEPEAASRIFEDSYFDPAVVSKGPTAPGR